MKIHPGQSYMIKIEYEVCQLCIKRILCNEMYNYAIIIGKRLIKDKVYGHVCDTRRDK